MRTAYKSVVRLVSTATLLGAFLPNVLSYPTRAQTPVTSPAPGATKTSPQPAKTTKAKVKTPKAKTLPTLRLADAYLGLPYLRVIRGVVGVEANQAICVTPDELKAAGLSVKCPELIVTGVPKGPTKPILGTLTFTDELGHSVKTNYRLDILSRDHMNESWIEPVGKWTITQSTNSTTTTTKTTNSTTISGTGQPPAQSSTVTVSPAPTPAPAKGADGQSTPPAGSSAATTPPTIKVQITSQLVAGASSIAGTVTTAGDGQSLPDTAVSGLAVQLRMEPATGNAYLAGLSGGTAAAPVNQAKVSKGIFVLNLSNPLSPGDTGRLELVPNADSGAFTLSGNLPTVAIKQDFILPVVTVTTPIRDGITTIDGNYTNVPKPAIASNATATPPVTGNLPSVEVWLHSPDAPAGEWYRADLLTGTPQKTVASIEAMKDGTFEALLKNPLTPGQTVKVRLYPPAGSSFRSDGQREDGFAESASPATGMVAYTSLAIAPPIITSNVAAGQAIISGTATPSAANGATVNIAVVTDDDFDKNDAPGASAESGTNLEDDDVITDSDRHVDVKNIPVTACVTMEGAQKLSERFLQLNVSSGTAAYVATAATTGSFSVTLSTPLIDGQRFHLVQILPANTELTDAEKALCKTTVSTAKGTMDWGRVHADFVAGVLISNDSTGAAASGTTASGDFSQAHQFYALTVEKVWALPGCYLRSPAHFAPDSKGADVINPAKCYDPVKHQLYPEHWTQHLIPGFSTYFQTRLTAIPVSTVATTAPASSTATSTSGSSGKATGSSAGSIFQGSDTAATGTDASTTSNYNPLTTAQTARVEVGAYLPFYVTRWKFNHRPYALFAAPLAKVGFDTVTGPSTFSTISPSGVAQTQTFEQAYSYWAYGARIGHMELTHSANHAPETLSYLDIAIGPYSNLQSYICHGSDHATTLPSTSYCVQPGRTPFVMTNGVDSRKRLYRFDIEGLLNIPRTPIYVGLNANIGQKTLGASGLDQSYAAPNDVRFLFGTKFDLATVIMKFMSK